MKYAHYFQAVTFILVVMNNGKEWNANYSAIYENSIGNKNDLQTYFNMKLIPMLKT
jgi:hypothetical protein